MRVRALAGEEGEQAHERQDEGDGERLGLAGDAGEDAHRRERGVDGEDPHEEAQRDLRRDAGESLSRRTSTPASQSAWATRARGETGQSSRPSAAPREQRHDHRGPDGVDGVGEDEDQARRVDGRRADSSEGARRGSWAATSRGTSAGGASSSIGMNTSWRGDRVAGADVERPAVQGVDGDERDRAQRRQRSRGRCQERERDDRDEQQGAQAGVRTQLAPGQRSRPYG